MDEFLKKWLRLKLARGHAANAVNDPERTAAFMRNVVQPRIAEINLELAAGKMDNADEAVHLGHAMGGARASRS